MWHGYDDTNDNDGDHYYVDDDDDDNDDDDDDDKPRLRPLQSVALCSLSSPTQEPVSPIKNKGATVV